MESHHHPLQTCDDWETAPWTDKFILATKLVSVLHLNAQGILRHTYMLLLQCLRLNIVETLRHCRYNACGASSSCCCFSTHHTSSPQGKGHYNVQTEGCEQKCKQTISEFKVFPPWNWLSCGGKPLYPPWIHRAASRTCLLGIQQFSPWTFQLCSIPSLLAHVYHPCHCWALQWQHWSLWLPRITLSAWHWHMGTVVR